MENAKPGMIAVVDDDEATCRSLERLLRAHGLPSLTFESAGAFLASGRLSDIGCLILDVRMPGLTGPELQKCLLKADVLMPIIFITGFVDEAVRGAAKEAGTVVILEKPFDEDILLTHVHAAIKVFKRGRES